jgi:hypothetical protein
MASDSPLLCGKPDVWTLQWKLIHLWSHLHAASKTSRCLCGFCPQIHSIPSVISHTDMFNKRFYDNRFYDCPPVRLPPNWGLKQNESWPREAFDLVMPWDWLYLATVEWQRCPEVGKQVTHTHPLPGVCQSPCPLLNEPKRESKWSHSYALPSSCW